MSRGESARSAVKQQLRELTVLLDQWDPLGVADTVAGEYGCCAPQVLGLLQRGGTEAELVGLLGREAESHFGVSLAPSVHQGAAANIVRWYRET